MTWCRSRRGTCCNRAGSKQGTCWRWWRERRWHQARPTSCACTSLLPVRPRPRKLCADAAQSWPGKNSPSMASSAEHFADTSLNPPVRGFLHRSESPNDAGLVLTHGAGSNCRAPLLVTLAEAFASAGFTVLRCDLPYRQTRPYGPPGPGDANRDREGLKHAVSAMRRQVSGRIFLGGHSYGGRQATMLCAEIPDTADGLLL